MRLYYYPPQWYNNIGNRSQHPLISNSLNNNNSYRFCLYTIQLRLVKTCNPTTDVNII